MGSCVANASDGSVRVLRGEDLTPIGRIDLGDESDDVRVDPLRNRVLVGYGNGALAVIDPKSQAKLADIRLKGHPEGFEIDKTGSQVFVNVPDAHDIEIADLVGGSTKSKLWSGRSGRCKTTLHATSPCAAPGSTIIRPPSSAPA